MPAKITPLVGPRRFQWEKGGWIGAVAGSSGWLLPTTVLLAVHQQPMLALLPAIAFFSLNVIGLLLWLRRDRILPFNAIMTFLGLVSAFTPLVWFGVSLAASEAARAAMNWPDHHMAGVFVSLLGPAIALQFLYLEYRFSTVSATPPVARDGG